MPRGVSLTPQARAHYKEDISQQLKLSLFEYPTEIRDAAFARATDVSSPTGERERGVGGGAAGEGGGRLLANLGWRRKRKNPSAPAVQVRVFDTDGNLTSRQTGVHVFHLRRETFFFVLRSLSWTSLLSFSVAVYLLLLVLISAMYYCWSWACGARDTTSLVSSLYFTVVSLAANGGYLGEDANTMANPRNTCYQGRTFIVMLCSYANILFVGLVAALVVGKAEYTGSLANRIEFSDFCVLHRLPGRIDCWRLAFRMANLENKKPLAHGQLRLYVVSAEPLKEYKMAKRARLLLKRKLEAMEWETREYLQEKGLTTAAAPLTAELLENKSAGLANTSFSAAAMAMQNDPNIRAIQDFKKRLAREKEREKEQRRAERRKAKEAKRKEKAHSGLRRPTSKPEGGAADNADNADTLETAVHVAEEALPAGGSGHRRHHPLSQMMPRRERAAARQAEARQPPESSSRRQSDSGDGAARATAHSPHPTTREPHDERRHGGGGGGGGGRQRRRGRRGLPSRDNSRGSSGGAASSASSASSSRSSGRASTATHSASEAHRQSRHPSVSSVSSSSTNTSTTSSTTNHSAKTNSSAAPSSAHSPLLKTHDGGFGVSFAGPSTGLYGTPSPKKSAALATGDRRYPSPTSSKPPMPSAGANERSGLLGSHHTQGQGGEKEKAKAGGASRGGRGKRHSHSGEDSETEGDVEAVDYMERVHINVSELDWVAPGESYLERGKGQLSLWYPATITHTIDERSPLYRFMDIPRVGASLGSYGSPVVSAESRRTPSSSAGLSSRKFQIVAVFDATEMETGATIMAKHTYTTTDIVTHYKFSNKLVHMNPESGEVLLDYHYFNEVLPVTAVESSTTDSEV